MDFVSGVTWRPSKRGLVVCAPGGSSLLVSTIERRTSLHCWMTLLGGSDADHQVVADLVAERIVADPTVSVREPHARSGKRMVFTRSGVEFTGIDGIAWRVHRYWGASCFYVDSSDGTTLTRRARIINALAGLIENGLPILEVDGQVAFADYLDEPDLLPRSREALRGKLRGVHHHDRPSWLAAYGAVSLIGGIVLLVTSTWVWWLAAGDMISALLGGNLAEILLGLYVIVPVALAALFSTIGLAVELVTKPTAVKHDQTNSSFDSQSGR
jgi:hypothetical protein